MITLMLLMSFYPINDLSDNTFEIHCIYLNEFDKKVNRYSSFSPTRDTLSIEAAIDMVRTCNTIAFSKTLNANEIYLNFVRHFYSECIELVLSKLEAVPSRGLSYYSEKHNISIGGSIHMNSKYCILDL
jgi:hypothetical protein